VVWRVPPLEVPSAGEPATVLGATDAERLFVERARLHRPDLAPAPEDAAAVAEVCRRLDGLPLAIELAAARVAVLSVAQLAARLDDRFRLLTGGGRAAVPRQQTLLAAMDWSYDLLTGPEQGMLRALSVFAGGFTLEAAEAVCAGGSPGGDVLDLLARLVDKSLVLAEEPGGEWGAVRYRLLETVRQYAAQRLTAAGEAQAARARHAAWCLDLAQAGAAHEAGPQQGAWLERLTVEHDNLRAALGWCLADAEGAAAGLRLGGLVGWMWEVRGHHAEGRRWLTALLARGEGAPPDVRATALDLAGRLTRDQGDYETAERLHAESNSLWRELGDAAGVAASLDHLGDVAAARGDSARARALFEESLALRRAQGDRRAVASSLLNLGRVARQQDESERAAALLEESLATGRTLGDTRGVARALLNLGHVHRDRGAGEDAAARYREGLSLYRELQDPLGAARCLEGLAAVAAHRGDAGLAARLGGAAAALREAVGVLPSPAGRAVVEQTEAVARAALGQVAFAAARAAGEGLPLEEVSAAALLEIGG
jgi:non-specific serine/threonine protein kinase